MTFSSCELIYIWRLRKGLTLQAAAKYWKVPMCRYRSWEEGKAEPSFRIPLSTKPRSNEIFIVLRRRMNWTQTQLAEKIGCSRQTLNYMEKGRSPVKKLREYWIEYL